MKIISITICFLLILFSFCCFAEDPVAPNVINGKFFIDKVNRIEKLYVIPPERRDFMGSRGIQKFDYQRIIPESERGENYIVTWRYRGEKINSPLVLKFEYKLSVNPAELNVEQYEYPKFKTGSYSWTFENIGTNYVVKGKVDRWKVTLLENGVPVSEKRSSTWMSMEGT